MSVGGSLGVGPNGSLGVGTNNSVGACASTSSISFLSSFNSNRTLPTTGGHPFPRPSPTSRQSITGDNNSPSATSPSDAVAEKPAKRRTADVLVSSDQQPATEAAETNPSSGRPTSDEEALRVKLSSTQRLLQESHQREKSLQYRLRHAESEVQVLRRLRPPLVLRIGKHRVDPRSGSYVQYEVCVERVSSGAPNQTVQYSLWRRYSQFKTMHDAVAKQIAPEAKETLPKLPPKKFRGNLDLDFIEARGKALNWYLQLMASIEPLRRCVAFKDFLVPSAGNGVLGGDIAQGERNVGLLASNSSDALIMNSAREFQQHSVNARR